MDQNTFNSEIKRFEQMHFNIYDELKKRPQDFYMEKQMLYPGKFYVFKYTTDNKKLFDLWPIVLSLGPDASNSKAFWCMNFKYMPRPVREKVVAYIMKVFGKEIDSASTKYPYPLDVWRQEPIYTCNYDNVKALLDDLGWRQALHKYLADRIVECYCIPYNLVPGLVLDDTDTFINGGIRLAQTPTKV